MSTHKQTTEPGNLEDCVMLDLVQSRESMEMDRSQGLFRQSTTVKDTYLAMFVKTSE